MATDLRVWLETLALDRYAGAFEANGIDLDILPELSDAELAALGVSMGDRKRLIRALERKAAVAAGALANGTDRTAQSRPAHVAAERRWMTVFFCDLVGSTEMSDRLDPEELRDVMTSYQNAVVGAVVRFQGYVGNFRGDGIIAYFGWPRAHEDQAERAVRAALEAREAVANVSPKSRAVLQVRVGITTGQVVISDIIAEGMSLHEAVGRTPNLAARLQAAASANDILIDEATRSELGRHFRLEPLAPLELRGLSVPVNPWRVVAPEPRATRFEARAASRAVLVGRASELALLVDRWHKARRGAGQVVLLDGETGIGKSRLLEAVNHAAATEPFLRLRYQCSPLHGDTPLYPVIHQFSRSLGFGAADSEEMRLAKLENNLGPLLGDNPHWITLIADLMSLPIETRPPLPDEPPPLRRDRLLTALATLIARLSRRQPVLAFIEDVQWIDPTTEELALRILGACAGRRLLAVVTNRVPFDPEWISGEHVTTLSLGRLSEVESAALVNANAGTDLSGPVAHNIATKADGVPLFLEELTRAVIERQAGGEDDGQAAHVDAGVPTTLQASLTSRLDHLEQAKVLAQIGAVVGREFPVELLAAVAERSVDDLAADIERLQRSELLFMRQSPSEHTLSFKHALVQDVAYEGLLYAERRRLHGAVLRNLEKLYPSQIDAMTDTLATHAERAEDWERAAKYLFAACLKATERFANREATSLYQRASAALARLPVETAAKRAIDLRLQAFNAFHMIGDHQKLVEIIGEAERLAEQIGDRRRIAATACQSALALWMAGDHAAALARGEAGLAIARELGDPALTLGAQFHLANVHHARGDLRAAIDLHRRVIDMLPGELATKRFGWGGAPGLFSRAFLGWYLVECGDFEEARQTLDESARILATVDQPFARVMILTALGIYHVRRGTFDEAVPLLREALDLSRTFEVLTMYPMAAAWLGQALTGVDCTASALAILIDAVDRGTYRFGGKYTWIYLYLALAEARYRNGARKAAYADLHEAFALAQSFGEIAHCAYALKLHGDFLLGDSNPAQARDAYARAVEIAEPRGIRPLAAHCKAGLAACARLLGDDQEAARRRAEASREFAAMGLTHWAELIRADPVACS